MGLFRRKHNGILSDGYIWMIMAGLLFYFGRVTQSDARLLEKIYPASINRYVIRFLSNLTGIFPFSVGEFFLYFHVVLAAILIIKLIRKIFEGGFFGLLYQIISYAALLYVVFMLVFGLNYNRVSVRETLGLTETYYGVSELVSMNKALIEKANSLRSEVEENGEGVFIYEGSSNALMGNAAEGYDKLGAEFPVFNGEYGIAKGILMSEAMNYTGITGVFMPYTGEANVNVKGPDLLFPATVLHEMAHQRGIAFEDEANYMAYLTSTYHSDADYRYSGTILALMNSMNALYKENKDLHAKLYATYAEGVRRDLAAYNEFYKPYEGEVEKAATKVNDTYLKGNGQVSGVKSYGEMVDLLLEQFMQKGSI